MADDLTEDDRDAIEQLALDAMKSIHKTGGRTPTNQELIEFMETHRTLFNGTELMDEERPKPPPKRGPKPAPPKKVTRYELHAGRMKGHYHRLIRLPRSGADARREVLADVESVVEGLGLADLPEHKRVEAVKIKLDLCGKTHDDKAIRDALRTLGLYQGKTPPD